MDSRFQVNLRGIIDLLARNIYGSPRVFMRELLQNAVDALRARGYVEPGFRGEIQIEVLGDPPVLIVADNGIGLTEDEIHQFLATIGNSSKSDSHWDRPVDFLGRFGIGLLSCFVVSEEIVVITRSSQPKSVAIEWRGRSDGTYVVRLLDQEITTGTRVYLTARADAKDSFRPEAIIKAAEDYGALLPFPICVTAAENQVTINRESPVWRRGFASVAERKSALLEYGRVVFQTDFFEAIPLRIAEGGIEGVVFILAHSASPASQRSHRIYLKGMFLTDSAVDLLPDWAFFVQCVLNIDGLEPTASRESFRQDESLDAARHALGRELRGYLAEMARFDSARLRQLLLIHSLPIRALAIQDEEFLRTVADWLPFETSLGEMTLGDYRRAHHIVRYTSRLEQFRQIAPIAAAQSLCVINAGYTYDAELIEKLPIVFAGLVIESVDAAALSHRLEELTLRERDDVFEFIRLADRVLQPYRCAADIRKFRPSELPALYCTGPEFEFLRSLEGARESSNPLLSAALDGVAAQLDGASPAFQARLTFNYDNSLIRRICRLTDVDLLQRVIRVLYVQSLLLGLRSLNAAEMTLLSRELLALIEIATGSREHNP